MTSSLILTRASPLGVACNAVAAFSAATAALTVDVIAKLHHFWTCRLEARALEGLSDEQLHDLGLTRADVARARALPLSHDPTLMLARTAEERRLSGESYRINPHWR